MASVPRVAALPWARQPSLLEKWHVHTSTYLGCLMRSQYSYATPVSLSVIDAAMAVSGNVGGSVTRQLLVTG